MSEEPIKTLEDLKNNIKTFEQARLSKDPDILEAYKQRVSPGKVFLPYLSEDGMICFVPSFWASRLNSSILNHELVSNGVRRGDLITEILEITPAYPDERLEKCFQEFCRYTDITPHAYRASPRRYWMPQEIADILDSKMVIELENKITIELSPAAITEREAITKARIGQSQFKNKLIEYWNGQCAVSGCDVAAVLKASHIKPWRVSDDKEKLDVYNGLLLLPNIDALFDKGFITFKDDGRITISETLPKNQYNLMGISEDIKIEIHDNHIPYLHYHRENVFGQTDN